MAPVKFYLVRRTMTSQDAGMETLQLQSVVSQSLFVSKLVVSKL